MVGQVNVYGCKVCGQETVTIDRDEGTTPAFIRCLATHGCRGTAVSHGYPEYKEGEAPEPRWEWYRPTLRAAHRFGASMLQHYRLGGLFLRRVNDGMGPPPEAEVPPGTEFGEEA